MLQETFTFLKAVFENYWSTYAYQGWFYLAILIILCKEKNKTNKTIYGIYATVFLVLIYNPLAIKFIDLLVGDGIRVEYYYRLYGFMPIMCLIAYGMVLILKHMEGIKKLMCVAFIAIVIVISGNSVYDQDFIAKADNNEKISSEVMAIANALDNIALEKGKVIKVASPADVSGWIKQYDGNLIQPYGRVWGENAYASSLINPESDVMELMSIAKSWVVDYIVVANNESLRNKFTEQGYEPVLGTASYLVYEVSGLAGYKYIYNDIHQIVKSTYYDDKNNPVPTSAGYCSVVYEYDLYGRNIKEMYLDVNDKPIQIDIGQYGVARQYDIKGNVTKLTYLDEAGQAMLTNRGYASISYKYNNKNKMTEEHYLDKDDKPVCFADDAYSGILWVYDSKNLEIERRYVDGEGGLVNNKEGYAVAFFERDERGNCLYEYRQDANGVSVAGLLKWQPTVHGIKRNFDEKNRCISLTYVDAKGNPMLAENGLITICYDSFDVKNRVTQEHYLDGQGKPIRRWNQYNGQGFVYNEQGKLISLKYLDEVFNPLEVNGVANIKYTYDNKGREILQKYYDAAGNPTHRNDNTYNGEKRSYNVANQCTSITYIDSNDNTVENKDGVAQIRYTYSKDGKLIETKNLSLDELNKLKEWTITDKGTTSGSQAMFYTIESDTGEFVIIDGGYDVDAELVKKTIAEHGNHVDAWIITHQHPDHAGAFNAIMSNNSGITVDHIYTMKANDAVYRATAADYDGIEVYDEFLKITKNMNNITYLKENDQVDIIGLNMKVLHAWDSDTDKLSANLMNNGGLVFTLSSNSESFLFCSDAENETEDAIIERHLADIRVVDYLQPGHHGNWGMTTKFYDYINPKLVIFDLPDNIIEDPIGVGYDAKKLWNYFVSRKIECKKFTDLPIEITMKN